MVQQMNVKRFYNNLPFNTGYDTKQNNIPWPLLHTYLKCSKTVTELGCGTGWLCARIKKQYPELEITGIDISKIAIEQACMRSNDVNYRIDNLLTYNKKSDVVISIGVLHHIETNNIKSLLHKAIALSKKYCFIGLYHEDSRKAMFDFFNNYPESKRKSLFKKMMPHMTNTEQRASWFRDQFYNPYEQSISLDTMKQVAEETNTKLEYTNINSDNTYNSVMEKLHTYEFTSGFIYGGYSK